ncbi:MAG: AAA family ATPase [Chloroflexi bacterium]|nr:AAA family ATPase [Chloroflexota bacterium]
MDVRPPEFDGGRPPSPDLRPSSIGQPGGAFVGREREFSGLDAALQDAVSGRGRVVMIAGEQGIGKTRMAEELAAHAQAVGAVVLWGRCHEVQGAPPFWPWIQVVRTYAAEAVDTARLRFEMGAGASDIARIAPEIRAVMPDLPPAPELDSAEANRFRLFDAVSAFLKRASSSSSVAPTERGRPIVILLDNLHRADRPSLQLFEFLAAELQAVCVLLVGTYRENELSRQHPLTDTLAELTRYSGFLRIHLRGFDQEAVARLVRESLPAALPEATIRELYSRSQGNPLFLTEMLRLLQSERRTSLAWKGAVPEGVRDVIRGRLNRLSAECYLTLAIASVIGREFDFSILSRLASDPSASPGHGLSAEALMSVLEEARDSRILEETPGVVGRYQFTHVLIQDTLSDELSVTRRAHLHGRIGVALEELYGANVGAHSTELAHHFARAAPVIGPQKLAHYSLMAGQEALSLYAYEDALAHFRRALKAKSSLSPDGSGRATDAEAAAILFGQARALTALLRNAEARVNLRRAFDFYAESGDAANAIAVAEFVPPGLVELEVEELTPRALRLAKPDSIHEGRLLCRYAFELGRIAGDYEGARDAFQQALAIARREGDSRLEMRTLANAADVESSHLHWDEALRLSLQAIALSERAEDLYSESLARFHVVLNGIRTGDLQTAQRHADASLGADEKLRDRFGLIMALWVNQLLAHVKGDWETARAFGEQGIALGGERPHEYTLRQCALLEYETGNFEQGAVYLDTLTSALRGLSPDPASGGTRGAMGVALVSRISGDARGLEAAETLAKGVLASPNATPLRTIEARAVMAMVALRGGDAALAAEQYAGLQTARGRMLSDLSGDRLLGLTAQQAERYAESAAHFEDALAFCRNAGYMPELAWTCHNYANLLIHTVGATGQSPLQGQPPLPDAREKAQTLLDEAIAISQRLGMRPLLERARALREAASQIVQPPHPPASEYPDGLTQREVEVLRLVAAGKSNREIGDALFISVNTVMRHMSNIFVKTNTSNRTEAALYAAQHRLT